MKVFPILGDIFLFEMNIIYATIKSLISIFLVKIMNFIIGG